MPTLRTTESGLSQIRHLPNLLPKPRQSGAYPRCEKGKLVVVKCAGVPAKIDRDLEKQQL